MPSFGTEMGDEQWEGESKQKVFNPFSPKTLSASVDPDLSRCRRAVDLCSFSEQCLLIQLVNEMKFENYL